jgi:predicted hydrocarbon binding protein
MSIERERKLNIIRSDEIDEALEMSVGLDYTRKAIDPLRKTLEFLESLRGIQVLPNVADVTIRVETLHRILNSFFNKLQDQYSPVMKRAGESVGTSFADNFMDFLEAAEKLPQNEEVLILMWTKIDSNAGWGEYDAKFNHAQKKIFLKLSNSLFTRILTKNKHRHCSFMEGYILGVLWGVLKRYHRWFSDEIRPLEKPALEPVKVVEIRPDDLVNVCEFEIELKEEELQESFDKFYKAKESFKEKDFTSCAVHLRAALEHGFKQKIDMRKEDPTSLTTLIKAYKAMEVKLPYGQVKDVWDALSRASHGTLQPSSEELKELIENVDIALRALEVATLSDAEKEQLRKKSIEIKGQEK